MQSKSQQPSSKHHFIPEFLLDQWAGQDRQLLRYYRDQRGAVRVKQSSPAGVCYKPDLYKVDGFPAEHAQQTESLFMSPLDSGAAKAHAELLTTRASNMTDSARCDWARFVMSIWFRTPDDVRNLERIVKALNHPRAAGTLLNVPVPAGLPEVALRQLRMDLLRQIIDDGTRGVELINIHWSVIEIGNGREFYVSDWPIDLPNTAPWLGSRESYLAMPISPSRAFIAAGSSAMLHAIEALPAREIEARLNRAVISHASSFVGAASERGKVFVERNFGSVARPSILGAVATRYETTVGI